MRSLPAVVAVVLGSVLVGIAPAGAQTTVTTGASAGPQAPASKAKDACALLTSQEITEIFTDAPLDPGPTKVELPKKGNKNFSQCLWDDEKTEGPVPQLIAKTSLARGINKSQVKLLTTPQPNANGRAISRNDLHGLGSKGVIEINPEGSYATVGALKGKDYYIVSVGYVGAQPFAPITDIEIMTLAREAAKRV
jgi:hypothetical protein